MLCGEGDSDGSVGVMTKGQGVLRHPIEHKIEALGTAALGAAGQLLLSRVLAKAAESAASRDPRPGPAVDVRKPDAQDVNARYRRVSVARE